MSRDVLHMNLRVHYYIYDNYLTIAIRNSSNQTLWLFAILETVNTHLFLNS